MTTPINQHAKILDLCKGQWVSTIDFRDLYGILESPARICELIKEGYEFHKEKITQLDAFGRLHKNITRYMLKSSPAQGDLFI